VSVAAGFDNPTSDFGASGGQRAHVVDVERLQAVGDALGR
jgi:hypothetical protein